MRSQAGLPSGIGMEPFPVIESLKLTRHIDRHRWQKVSIGRSLRRFYDGNDSLDLPMNNMHISSPSVRSLASFLANSLEKIPQRTLPAALSKASAQPPANGASGATGPNKSARAIYERKNSLRRLGLTSLAAQHTQTRQRITVVEKLPEEITSSFVGYHGSTRNNFNAMSAQGVNFNLTGKNFDHDPSLGLGAGLYVTEDRENAYAYANQAARRSGGNDKWEIASVYLAKPAKGFVERQVPFDLDTADVERYRKTARDAHQLNLSPMEKVVTPLAAESQDINYYVVRDARSG